VLFLFNISSKNSEMTQKLLLTLFTFLMCNTIAHAQLEKTIHQTFEIGNTDAVTFELISDTTLIVPWAGNNILTETKIELYDASPSILKHFVEKESRYVIEADTTGGNFKLYSDNKERKPIRTRSGECPEIVQIRVFVPENFELQDNKRLVRIK